MTFNSLAFLVFAAVFLAVWPWVRARTMPRWLWITSMSLLFYGWWDWRYVPLLLTVALANYVAGNLCHYRPTHKALWLALGLVTSLGVLGAFKYSGFAARNLDVLTAMMGGDARYARALPNWLAILPVGISFYTFQAMSYSIDLYRGQLHPARNVWHYLAYLTMFPQLVAGPIERASDLLPQIASWRTLTEDDLWVGLRLVVHGYFKKVVIADNLSTFVDTAFGAPVLSDNGIYWWWVMLAFSAQIYCDFSGYSDIARGLARWMGYQFVANFEHPYLSRSLREFWTRWHTSLSTWFRDYVYIPLGGNRRGMVWGLLAMSLTMVLSGIWHGAAWTFVIWGGLHAGYLAVERITRWPDRLSRMAGGPALAHLIVLILVVVAWVFFRSSSSHQAGHIVAAMFTDCSNWPKLEDRNWMLILCILVGRELYVGAIRRHLEPRLASWRPWLDPVTLAAMIVACILLRGAGGQFIYFQF